MNTVHAPVRCSPGASRLAKVKFVALPMELAEDAAVSPAPDYGTRGQAPSGAQFPRRFSLRAFLLRVIGRLEAARP